MFFSHITKVVRKFILFFIPKKLEKKLVQKMNFILNVTFEKNVFLILQVLYLKIFYPKRQKI